MEDFNIQDSLYHFHCITHIHIRTYSTHFTAFNFVNSMQNFLCIKKTAFHRGIYILFCIFVVHCGIRKRMLMWICCAKKVWTGFCNIVKPMVYLLWSESVDELVNLLLFPFSLVSFHTEKYQANHKVSLKATRMFTLLIG